MVCVALLEAEQEKLVYLLTTRKEKDATGPQWLPAGMEGAPAEWTGSQLAKGSQPIQLFAVVLFTQGASRLWYALASEKSRKIPVQLPVGGLASVHRNLFH